MEKIKKFNLFEKKLLNEKFDLGNTVKMYYFNPHDYDYEYFVAAENKIKAYKYLIEYLNKMAAENPKNYSYLLDIWNKINPLDASSFPEKYTLDEYEVGSVVQTEIS